MRIAIDARELQGRPTGVGRYVSEIVRRWAVSVPPVELRLYAATGDGALSAELPGEASLAVRWVDGRAGTYWEQWALPAALRHDGSDVLFSPAYSSPLVSPCPVALTIHDVSFCAHPEWFGWREGVRRRFLARQCARRAAALFTVSAFSADEMATHLGLARRRIDVVPNGIDHVARRPNPAPRWLARQPTPHVVSVGSIFNRRHVPTLVRAFAEAFGGHPAARLSIAGDNRTHPRLDLDAIAREAGVADRTQVLSYAPTHVIEELFETADIAVFVSEYEGFGLPMLEPLSRGVPVIVADTAVSHEVCGSAASYVPPGDVAALARALGAALHERPRLAEQLSHAGAILDRYRWDEAAAAILARLTGIARP